uniref:Putative secreted peptide n=1 Tax=Anopheles braziliensis TaxID=58242 RepID=A0A2M3ZVA2_9DIPT
MVMAVMVNTPTITWLVEGVTVVAAVVVAQVVAISHQHQPVAQAAILCSRPAASQTISHWRAAVTAARRAAPAPRRLS